MNHFTKYQFNSAETEILGKIFQDIHRINEKHFDICPIWTSQLTLQIPLPENDYPIFDVFDKPHHQKPVKSHSINDVYGLYHHDFIKKSKSVIVLCESRMKEVYKSKARFEKIRTVVLLHEIGHWIAYSIFFDNSLISKKDCILNPAGYCEDKEFQELWAQIFCYKALSNSMRYNSGSYSYSTEKYINSCKKLMLDLADNQKKIYQNFRTFRNGDSLSIIESIPYEKLYIKLQNLRTNFKTDFYQKFTQML